MGNLRAKHIVALTALSGVFAETQQFVRRQLIENGLSAALCEVATDHPANVELTNTDFEFWYAIGTSGSMDAVTLFNVEQLLYTSIQADVLWCTPITGSSQLLGVVAFTPGIADTPTEFNCPDVASELIAATGATDCVVVRGSMRILAQPIDTINFAVSGLQVGLKNATSAGALGLNGEIKNVTFVSYLGNNESEALRGSAVVSGGGTGAILVGSAGGSGKQIPLAAGLGLGVPVVFALFAAAFIAKKRRAPLQDSRRLHDSTNKTSAVAGIGNGDPPDSFHDGLYHYTSDGKIYQSSHCELCLETKRNSIYSINGVVSSALSPKRIAMVVEDAEEAEDQFQDEMLLRADSSLGITQHHMGINVHECNSATCALCKPRGSEAGRTTFVSTDGAGGSISGTGSTMSGAQSGRSSVQSSWFNDSRAPSVRRIA